MKKVFLFFILFQVSLNLFSQKEIFFSTKAPDSIKVESMQGVKIQSSLNPITAFNIQSFNIPINIGYFNEKRIASSWTIIYSADVSYNYSRIKNTIMIDTIYNGYIPYSITSSYSLGINLKVEPRWYSSYKNRYPQGKANLNSGWYLSLPVSYGIALMSNSDYFNKPTWFSDKYYGSLGVFPLLGYRQAISKSFFLEGDIEYINGTFGFYAKNKTFFITGPFLLFSPTISIKAAYTFK